MGRVLTLVYGIAAYAIAMASILYAIGFLANLWVPKSIDSGADVPLAEAIIVNMLLLGLFAVQHSVMARPAFKKAWTRIVPVPVERSTYVLFSALVLGLLFCQWRPISGDVWNVSNATGAALLWALYFLGWGIVFFSTFLINHFDLFGLKQVYEHWAGKAAASPEFKTPLLYKLVRHPIYLGFLLTLWATPVMTHGHLLFAALSTGYILIGATLEERDLVTAFGDAYRDYRKRVPMLLPVRFRR